ncbi:hypothetical protein [Mucilaginibacter sp.]
MKNNAFNLIKDSYQLVTGARIRSKYEEEIFELGQYDPLKRGYTLYPYEDGVKFDDFSVIISEKELMNHYEIEGVKATAAMLQSTSATVPLFRK